MKKINNNLKNNPILIIAVTIFIYVMMVGSKNLYTAEIVEVIKHFKGCDKTKAGLAMTFYFCVYAVMQFVVAKILPKINIIKVTLYATVLSSIVIAITPLCVYIWQVYILFGLNAVLQCTVWPCCIYVVGNYIDDTYVPKANMALGTGYAIGFVLDYLVAALCIQYLDWCAGFYIFGFLYLISGILFCTVIKFSDKVVKKGSMILKIGHNTLSSFKPHYRTFCFVECVGCFLSTMMYYGVSSWITSLFCDVYNVSSANSALISIIVPVIVIVGPILATSFCEKERYWTVSIIVTLFAVVVGVVLAFLYSVNIWFTLIASILFLIFSRGVSHIYDTIIPIKSRGFVDAGVFAAITNSFASMGGALGPTVTGKIMDVSSRRVSYLFLAICGVILILTILIPYKKISDFD